MLSDSKSAPIWCTGKCLVQCIVGQFWLVEVGDSIFASNGGNRQQKILVSNAKSPPTSCRKGYFDQSCIWTWIKPNPGNLYLGISLVPCCWSCIWFRINICNGCKGNKSTVPRDCSWPANLSQSNCHKLVDFMRLLPQCSGMESHWMLCKNKPCTNRNRKI